MAKSITSMSEATKNTLKTALQLDIDTRVKRPTTLTGS